jgi:hypothetical protein
MTFASAPFASRPFADDGQEIRVYLDLALTLDASLQFVMYVASAAGVATLPSDDPPNQPFRGVLQRLTFERSILQSDIGQFTTGTGTLVISNSDAFYDFLPLNYAIDGRPINLKVGRRDDPYGDSFPFARLTATGWNIDVDQIAIDLVDYSYKLEVPLQPNVYGGAGGADGTSDLAGKRKPLVFGNARNISPVALVPSLLIYQAHDGPMQSIDVVYDRAVPLTAGTNYASYAALAAASVSAGQYATCLVEGLIKLGSTPAGTVTSDVKGANAGGYVTTSADVVRWALRNRTSLVDPDDLDVASFARLNVDQPAPIDYFVGPDDSQTVAAFIANIMAGIGGWGGHKTDGTFEVRIFRAATGASVDSYVRADMLGGDIKREPLPASYKPPSWRWRVVYARSWTVQTDLAGAVTASQKAFVSEAYRLAESSNAAIKVDHPFAQDRAPVEAYFSLPADAAAEALRRLTLFKATSSIYRWVAPRRALRRDLGDEVLVTHPRFDLSLGRSLIVVETKASIDAGANSLDTVEIAAYG